MQCIAPSAHHLDARARLYLLAPLHALRLQRLVCQARGRTIPTHPPTAPPHSAFLELGAEASPGGAGTPGAAIVAPYTTPVANRIAELGDAELKDALASALEVGGRAGAPRLAFTPAFRTALRCCALCMYPFCRLQFPHFKRIHREVYNTCLFDGAMAMLSHRLLPFFNTIRATAAGAGHPGGAATHAVAAGPPVRRPAAGAQPSVSTGLPAGGRRRRHPGVAVAAPLAARHTQRPASRALLGAALRACIMAG